MSVYAQKTKTSSSEWEDQVMLRLYQDSTLIDSLLIEHLYNTMFRTETLDALNWEGSSGFLIYKTEFDACPSTVYQALIHVDNNGLTILSDYYDQAIEEGEAEYESTKEVYLPVEKYRFKQVGFFQDVYEKEHPDKWLIDSTYDKNTVIELRVKTYKSKTEEEKSVYQWKDGALLKLK